ncbi:hypothetical protein EBBID32_15870 [Sphingobium indicum BiD32]|uniref:Uncharacterized protein n=1 Tax=Sphingobium indicum BiD32 TaxID=1301087 RepID=N1MP86_9SPHN|nr:hypothetical protein EBBID32_15870 [Sphingobium indicum BiD32]
MNNPQFDEPNAPVQVGCWGQAAIIAAVLFIFFLAVPWD